jgi:hypothetical protein
VTRGLDRRDIHVLVDVRNLILEMGANLGIFLALRRISMGEQL